MGKVENKKGVIICEGAVYKLKKDLDSLYTKGTKVVVESIYGVFCTVHMLNAAYSVNTVSVDKLK